MTLILSLQIKMFRADNAVPFQLDSGGGVGQEVCAVVRVRKHFYPNMGPS